MVVEREGCFVFRVLSDYSINVRSGPSTDVAYRTDFVARPGNLVSINAVMDTKDMDFLQLADGSGWLFTKGNDGQDLMEQVPVETGLWTFYVDNSPAGIILRIHPMDDSSQTSLRLTGSWSTSFPPMTMIHCDRKVVNGPVTFYRLQGSRSSWVFDKRITTDGNKTYMLIPERSVRTGLFAYESFSDIPHAIRYTPNVGDDAKIHGSCINHPGELVACDLIRDSPTPEYGNGPFLRLTNSLGWLFERKYGNKVMQEVHVEEGQWGFTVVNSAGIQLRKQPVDDFSFRFDTVYPQGHILSCDRRIASSSGVHFYRVMGTNGWVFDRRNNHPMMLPRTVSSTAPGRSNGWDPEFVRGVACAVGSLKEIAFNERSRVISFSREEGYSQVRINVYYTTRTIGTALGHPRQGHTQLFRRNCTKDELSEILKNPRLHTGRGYQERRKIPRSNEECEVDAEEEMRRSLAEVEESISELNVRKNQLVASLMKKVQTRLSKAKQEHRLLLEHLQVMEQKKQKERQKKEQERQRLLQTCKHCGKFFGSESAMQNHTNAVHSMECHVCNRTFQSWKALHQHQDATGHTD